MDELEELLDRVEKDEEIRVFIFSGAGQRYFASGGDLKEFQGLKTEEDAIAMSERMGKILKRIEKLKCWTIACINGDAYGGGCELMLAFDFRIAVKHARFGFTQGKFYLPPGWGGLTRLVERVGRSTALLWLGKQALVDAETGFANGLIDQLQVSASIKNYIRDTAKALSVNDRRLIAILKKGAHNAVKKGHYSSIDLERKAFAELWADEEHHDRVDKFLKKGKDSGRKAPAM